jgi:hypothetical protein
VYGRSERLSRILRQQRISLDRVARWKQDGRWLVRFLRRLRLKLIMQLTAAVPGQDPYVLSLWYGLDGEGLPTAEAIGAQLGMAAERVRAVRRSLLAYLRGENGRSALEKAILDAAKEIEKAH